MTPFIARHADGEVILVLGFVTRFGDDVDAIVTTPEGGRVWSVALEEVYDAVPTSEWPIGARALLESRKPAVVPA